MPPPGQPRRDTSCSIGWASSMRCSGTARPSCPARSASSSLEDGERMLPACLCAASLPGRPDRLSIGCWSRCTRPASSGGDRPRLSSRGTTSTSPRRKRASPLLCGSRQRCWVKSSCRNPRHPTACMSCRAGHGWQSAGTSGAEQLAGARLGPTLAVHIGV